jgi:hypothetical protein
MTETYWTWSGLGLFSKPGLLRYCLSCPPSRRARVHTIIRYDQIVSRTLYGTRLGGKHQGERWTFVHRSCQYLRLTVFTRTFITKTRRVDDIVCNAYVHYYFSCSLADWKSASSRIVITLFLLPRDHHCSFRTSLSALWIPYAPNGKPSFSFANHYDLQCSAYIQSDFFFIWVGDRPESTSAHLLLVGVRILCAFV